MTPFEIRLELLKMARDLLVTDFNSQKESLTEQWQMQVESAKISGLNRLRILFCQNSQLKAISL